MSFPVRLSYPLKTLNTFAVEAQARAYVQVRTDQEVSTALQMAQRQRLPVLILGGGSNLLLTRDFDGLVLHMCSQGRRILHDDGDRALIEAEAGENWHALVLWSLQQSLQGLENLSLIPGTVGAAPVQNIGAYGVELKDAFHSLTAFDRQTGEVRIFSAAECAFAYRESVFKQTPDRWVILRVRLSLSRQVALKLDYGPVRQWLIRQGIEQPTATDVSRAVCAIRSEKLPDPTMLGNAGSFFKNPLVTEAQATELRCRYSDLIGYPANDGYVKLAAGWLIEKAGWKGYRDGDAGVHQHQALVLVNYGKASGQAILSLAHRIQTDIEQRFGIALEVEPKVL